MAGRPVEFTEEIQEQAWEYLNGGWEKEGHMVPSVVGMCLVIKRAKSTIYDWAKRDDNQFSDILECCNEMQEFYTINGALSGKLNAQISKLLLGKHGYHERKDLSVKDDRNREYSGSEAADSRIAEMLGKGAMEPNQAPITH